MKQQLDYRTNELSKANEQLYDQKMMIRQMEEHNNQVNYRIVQQRNLCLLPDTTRQSKRTRNT